MRQSTYAVGTVKLSREVAFASCEGSVGELEGREETAVRMSGRTGGAAAKVGVQSSKVKIAANWSGFIGWAVVTVNDDVCVGSLNGYWKGLSS